MFHFLLILAICPFCNPEVIDAQRVTETERFNVLYSIRPVTEGNLLLVPKRHFTRFEELDEQEGAELLKLIEKTQSVFKKRYGISDYMLLQKNGRKAGQTVAHSHVHIIPCPDDIDYDRIFLYKQPISREEMQEKVSELKPYFE
jgi:histidine triad (HIT) family protein